jgi:exonuclease VII large subunit
MAIGINDFAADPRNPTPADHELARQKIAEHVAKVTGQAAASPIAEVAVLRAEKQQLEAQVNETRTNLETERAARQLAESQRDKLLQSTPQENGAG